MSAFTSMLVPLESLVLLPLALAYSKLNLLLLLIVIPLVAAIVIAVVVKATTRPRQGADADPRYTDPTWIGSKAQHDEVLGTDNAASQAALQGGPTGRGATEDDKGGASARW